jgi:hypothetical protein
VGGGGGVAGSGVPASISRPYGAAATLSDDVLNWRLGVGGEGTYTTLAVNAPSLCLY